jgi:hypothetical protein
MLLVRLHAHGILSETGLFAKLARRTGLLLGIFLRSLAGTLRLFLEEARMLRRALFNPIGHHLPLP